ncbi:MAG: sensor histidine kinase [Candidatus Hodarchaeota archaeon]
MLISYRMEQDYQQAAQEIFNAIPDPTYLFKRQFDGEYILEEANRTARIKWAQIVESFTGKSLSQIIMELLGKTEIENFLKKIENVIETNQPFSEESELRTPFTQQKRWFFLQCAKPDEEGLLIILRDIDDKKRSEELLKSQKEELSDFARYISHAFRNQLLSIEGYAQLLQEGHDIELIQRILDLVLGMNDFLRRSVTLADAGLIIEKAEEIELAKLICEATKDVISEDVALVVGDLPLVYGDSAKLQLIFQNLFENAVTHGNAKSIEVRSEMHEVTVSILISNDGLLIPVEHHEKIFDKGFTTKPRRSSGFGLAIVKKVIEAHGRSIALCPAQTTTFQIAIPRTSAFVLENKS